MRTLDSREGYDIYAPQYRKDHPHLDSFDWEDCRQRLAVESERQLALHPAGIRLLDLGCGDGRALKRLQRLGEQKGWTDRVRLHGWDISEGMLKQAAKALGPGVKLERRDLREAAGSERRFHLVASFFVLVHIDHPDDFCRAALDLLEPGGSLVFNNIPQRDALVLESGGQKFRIDYRHHADSDVAAALEKSGLVLQEQHQTAWSTVFVARRPD
jgi:2-polyprenyl-3-methyl-5-hydroxy-6-metoxy-1,4-benzoquinol methylase